MRVDHTKLVSLFSKGISGDHIDRIDVDGTQAIELSALPKPLSDYERVILTESGVTIIGFAGRSTMLYDAIGSILVPDMDEPPEVVFWGARYWMVDRAFLISRAQDMKISVSLALSTKGLRQIYVWSRLFSLLEKERRADGSRT